MRILYFHRTLADGAEGIHIREMVRAFRGLGHDVHVEGLAGQSGSASYGLAERMKASTPRVVFECAAAGANVAEFLNVRRAIKNIRPHFLYQRHGRFSIGALRAAHAAGVPTVLEVNCLFVAPPYERFEPLTLRRLAAYVERRALQISDVVLAVSTPLARQIAQASSVDAVVLPNGVDADQFDPAGARAEPIRKRYQLESCVTVGWSGVIREWHGLDLLLDALALVPDVRLLVVGDGPARQSMEAHASRRGVRDRIVITGHVAHAQMPDHIAAMDIAVVASDSTGVASPMKLVEYMAMSRPVVAPRLKNIQDVLVDETDGLLFSPGDPISLSSALRRLLADTALRERLGQAARLKIERSHTWRHNAELVAELVERRRARTLRIRRHLATRRRIYYRTYKDDNL